VAVSTDAAVDVILAKTRYAGDVDGEGICRKEGRSGTGTDLHL
jgi:hypothetical protein